MTLAFAALGPDSGGKAFIDEWKQSAAVLHRQWRRANDQASLSKEAKPIDPRVFQHTPA